MKPLQFNGNYNDYQCFFFFFLWKKPCNGDSETFHMCTQKILCVLRLSICEQMKLFPNKLDFLHFVGNNIFLNQKFYIICTLRVTREPRWQQITRCRGKAMVGRPGRRGMVTFFFSCLQRNAHGLGYKQGTGNVDYFFTSKIPSEGSQFIAIP